MSQACELNIYFVLPEEDADTECSKDMYEAFRCVKQYKGKPKWILPSECIAHRTTSSDVFVLEEFAGPAFEKLKKDSAKVLGAKCMLTCMSSGDTIPPGDSPIFTEGMRGLIVCCTGFDSETKKKLQERIEHMAGVFHPTLRSMITHVVAHNNISLKAIEAYNAKKPIMKLEWVEAVWNRSIVSNVRGSDSEFRKYEAPLFHNLKITASGMSRKKKEEIKQLIIDYGGTFTGTLEMNSTNILIVETPDGDKYEAAIGWKIPCLRSSWLRRCVELKKIVSLDDYKVEKQVKISTPKKGLTVNLTGNFSMVSAIEADDRQYTHLEESSNITCSQPLTQPKLDPLAQIIDKITIDALNAGQFLDGCNVYLSGFNQSLADKLRKILNFGGATRFDELSRSVTHIIVPRLNGDCFKETTAYILPLEWLQASVALKKPAPVDEYVINVNGSSNSAPPSPLSKQSARLLSKPEPKSLQSEFDNLAEPLDFPLDDDLAYRYQQSQQGEPISQRPARSNISINRSAQNNKSEMSITNGEIFNDLRFFLSSKLTPEELTRCQELILKYNGKIVNKRFTGVPNYAVVPIAGDSLTEITALEVVNLMFIQDCIQQNQVVPVQYYHQPLTLVTGSTPLVGCVICVTKYVGCERDFIESVIEQLGAVVQAVLVKKPKRDVLQTTHLICAEPSGAKFEGAIRWGLPVVHHNWLFKCAELGVKVSEEEFLLSGNKPSCGHSNASQIATPLTAKKQPESASSIHTESSTPIVRKESLIVEKTPSYAPKSRILTPEVVKAPLEMSKTTTPLIQSQGVHKIVERLKNAETPTNSQSLDLNQTTTPTTPYGACYGTDNPSPNTRKRLKKWIDQGASYELDPPSKRPATASQRRDSTPLSDLLSKQLKMMMRRPEDQPPDDSPEIQSSRRLNFTRSESLAVENDVLNGLQRMKEIEESYSKAAAAPSLNQVSAPEPEPKILLFTESQPHTEIGWDDPPDRDFALANLEKEEVIKLPDKIFMFSALSDSADTAKQLIIESKGKVSPLPNFDKSATHLIAAANMTRAEKLLGSIAAGLWVLHPSYLKQLARVKDVYAIKEEDYEWGNPNISMPLDALLANVRDCVVNAYHWRCEITTDKTKRPFAGMRFILMISTAKRDVFTRLLDAGGGEIITPKDINENGKHFCISEMSAPPSKMDMENFASKGVCCVTTLFISDVILRKTTATRDNMVPDFVPYWNRHNR